MAYDTISKLLEALKTSGLNHEIEADLKPIGDKSFTGQRMQIRLNNGNVCVIDTRARATIGECQHLDELSVSRLVLEAVTLDKRESQWM